VPDREREGGETEKKDKENQIVPAKEEKAKNISATTTRNQSSSVWWTCADPNCRLLHYELMQNDPKRAGKKSYHTRLHDKRDEDRKREREVSGGGGETAGSDGVWYRCPEKDCDLVHNIINLSTAGRYQKKQYHLMLHKVKKDNENQKILDAEKDNENENADREPEKKKKKRGKGAEDKFFQDQAQREKKKVPPAREEKTSPEMKKKKEMENEVWWSCPTANCQIPDATIHHNEENKRVRKIGHIAMHKKNEAMKKEKHQGTAHDDEEKKLRDQLALAASISVPVSPVRGDERAPGNDDKDHSPVAIVNSGGQGKKIS